MTKADISFKDLLSMLQADCTECKNVEWEDCISDYIYFTYLKDNYEIVAKGLNIDKRRWYEMSTTVIRIKNRYLGIHHVTDVFSEQMSVSDCEESAMYFEMEKVMQPTYVPKTTKDEI